ncbi:MAG: molybdopterin-guanine dinucleotide biosynthesis protein B [Pseudomonadota bacterium]
MSEWPRNIFGVAGWKNTGKTTLVERLVRELTERGLRVATLKHAHHDFTTDVEGTDSHRHRSAGAVETIVASSQQNVQIRSVRLGEPSLQSLINRLDSHDIVLVEGWKSETHPKLMLVSGDEDEVYPGTLALVTCGNGLGPLAKEALPVFDRDEISSLVDVLLSDLKDRARP